jgi:hypothetical protein
MFFGSQMPETKQRAGILAGQPAMVTEFLPSGSLDDALYRLVTVDNTAHMAIA